MEPIELGSPVNVRQQKLFIKDFADPEYGTLLGGRLRTSITAIPYIIKAQLRVGRYNALSDAGGFHG